VVNVVGKNEVYIGGTYFRTVGPVRVTNISVTPNPVVFGDTQRAGDTQVMSQLIQASNVGGSGIYKANPRIDTERCWKSRAETRFPGFTTLPPYSFNMGRPAAITSEILMDSQEFQGEQYFVFSNKVYRWLEATLSWSVLDRTLGSNPTDSIVFRGSLYYACGPTIEKRTTGAVWTTAATPAAYFTIWDDRLWRLGETVPGVWQMFSSLDAITWSAAVGELPTDTNPSQLTVYRDVGGASAIYAMTNTGPWVYDANNARFLQSEIRIPRVPAGERVRATVFRDGKLYMSSGGLGMVSIQAGNPFVAAPMGLDMDDGVPAEDAGRISAIASDFNWLLALTDSSQPGSQDEDLLGVGEPFEDEDWSLQQGTATLRAWNGGWHVLWESTESGIPGQVVVVSSAYGVRRIYWGAQAGVFYQDSPTQVHNPRHNPNKQFAPGPVEHITSWYSYGSEAQQKIHGHFYVYTKDCSEQETVTVAYGTELDDNVWTVLGTITGNGKHEFLVGGPQGQPGQFFRFRITLQRGSNLQKRPIVEYWSSEIMRLLPATYGYAVILDLTGNHRNLSPAQLRHAIQRLADPKHTPELVQFSFRDEYDDEPQTFWAKISRLTGSEYLDRDIRGQGEFQVSLMVPYQGDSE
jgi:hypothetical protein